MHDDGDGMSTTSVETFDPALMAVLANRFNVIVREMTSALLRSGRSAIINVARDFSCAIVTAEDELLASAEGLPNHIFGAHLQAAEMRRLHPDVTEGDAFLDNDVYVACNHQADHTILVPVFVDGEHMFTAVAKAHQADIGNSQPTTYMSFAKDCYEEGALTFPCVRIQRDYQDVEDIIRMCRRRIRVPDQWYGDYLASLGAARTAERRLQELVGKYGKDTIRTFVREWFDYSERRIEHAIKQLPSGRYVRHGQHDAVGPFEAVPFKVEIEVDAEAGRIVFDLRDNPDCREFGLNLTRATSTCNCYLAAMNNLGADVPHNHGSFRRLDVLLRENCVVGYPRHPTCASVATTNLADRLVNVAQAAFEAAGPDYGVAEGGLGLNPGYAVISGTDWRTGHPYVNQIVLGNNAGPGTPTADGWLTWVLSVCAGRLYRDSVEIDEQKYPIHVEHLRVLTDGGGAGRRRGAPAVELAFGARGNPMTVIWTGDGHDTPPQGVHGGGAGSGFSAYKVLSSGEREPLPPAGQIVLEPGELIVSQDCSGGGFGDPLTREPERVLKDVVERWVSPEAAAEVYGVVLEGSGAADLRIDEAATAQRRAASREDG